MKTKNPKINFKNRNSRRDKRRKNVYPDNIQGDFALVMDNVVDNSMGDNNYLVFNFIESHVPNCRKKFQKFLQDWTNSLDLKVSGPGCYGKEI